MSTQTLSLAKASQSRGMRLSGVLDWAQGGITLAVILATCRGRFGLSSLVLPLLILPALRGLVAPSYRRRLQRRWQRLWGSLIAYPASPASAIPWRATWLLVVLPSALLYLGSKRCAPASDWWPVMLNASSLTSRWSWELSEDAWKVRYPDGSMPYFFTRTTSGIYSNYPSGMVVFALPAAAASHLLGKDPSDFYRHHDLDRWTAAWSSAACVGLFFLIALHIVPPGPAWITAIFLASGSVMFSTVGQSLWQHGGVIFWSMIVLLLECRQSSGVSRLATLSQGVALGMMLACRLTSSVFIMVFGLWILCRAPRRAAVIVAGAALAYLPWAVIYHANYRKIFGPSTGQLLTNLWTFPDLEAWAGVLFSPARGLLIYQPWILLIGLSLFLGNQRHCFVSGWKLFCASYVVLHLALVSSWGCWWGGSCWGSRLASEAVPIAALLCLQPIAALSSTSRGRCFLIALMIASCLVHLPGVYSNADAWNNETTAQRLWSCSDPPFLYCLLH